MSLGEKEVSLMGLRVRKRQLNCMEYSSFALSRAPKSRDENTLLYIKSDYISTLVLNQPPNPPPSHYSYTSSCLNRSVGKHLELTLVSCSSLDLMNLNDVVLQWGAL